MGAAALRLSSSARSAAAASSRSSSSRRRVSSAKARLRPRLASASSARLALSRRSRLLPLGSFPLLVAEPMPETSPVLRRALSPKPLPAHAVQPVLLPHVPSLPKLFGPHQAFVFCLFSSFRPPLLFSGLLCGNSSLTFLSRFASSRLLCRFCCQSSLFFPCCFLATFSVRQFGTHGCKLTLNLRKAGQSLVRVTR